MRNVDQKMQQSSSSQSSGAGAQPQAPKYPLEAIIALQKSLQNGIPEHDGERTYRADEPGLVAGQQDCNEHVVSWEPLLVLNPLMLLLGEVRQLVSVAAQSYRSGSHARQSTTAHFSASWQ